MINQTRLTKIFTDLVKIDSISGEEAKAAAFVKKYLQTLKLTVKQDKRGNLYCYIPGQPKTEPIIICAHLDTVEPGRGIVPVLSKGTFRSKGNTILGADDKAGVAEMLEFAADIAGGFKNYRPVELLFTLSEEAGDSGAKKVEPKMLSGRQVLVIDAGEPGKIVKAAPFILEYKIKLIGRAAHSGAHPEQGKNAMVAAARAIAKMPVGRVDKFSTANVGFLKSGHATNAVPAEAEFSGEIRSHKRHLLDKIFDRITDTVAVEARKLGVKVEMEHELFCDGYYYSDTDPFIHQVQRLMKQAKLKPHLEVAGGVSDANMLSGKGFKTLDVGAGYFEPHTTNENIKLADMVKMVKFLQLLVSDK